MTILDPPTIQTTVGPTKTNVPPVYQDDTVTVHLGDCLTILRCLPDESVHSVVTDPPYAIETKRADLSAYAGTGGESCEECGNRAPQQGFRLCSDCLESVRVCALMSSPMLGMQSQNWSEKATHSRGYASNNNQDFQKWCSLWLNECLRVLKPGGHLIAFGGTRTWHRLAVAAEDAGFEVRDSLAWLFGTGFPKSLDVGAAALKLAENSSDGTLTTHHAERWSGWSTTLKPGHEPIVLARKPFEGPVTVNVLKHGTGALNVKGPTVSGRSRSHAEPARWRSNTFLDHSQASSLDETAGESVSRFFWVAKPTGSERVRIDGIAHPTVKPLDLMRELTRLVTKPGQTVLEPFAGSGTTVEACILEGLNVVAIERDEVYLPLILHRIDRRSNPLTAGRDLDRDDTPDLFEDWA